MMLSEHFSLEEMLRSHVAVEKKISEQFTPGEAVIINLKALCVYVLEPVRQLAGMPLKISSGYRCPALNKAIKGSSTSQHMLGQAADIDLGSKPANKLLFEMIRKSNIAWDQMIYEFGDEKGPDWVHISYLYSGRNRKQIIRIS